MTIVKRKYVNVKFTLDKRSLHNRGHFITENSSGAKTKRTGLSKAGNSHLRQLLTEAAGGICKGMVGHKSKELKARQKGNTDDVIKYADKANVRLRSRYYKLITKTSHT